MTTHRSLNKLERKAHMSLHNTLEVTGQECDELSYTRDRFGKKHSVSTSQHETE